MKRMIAIVLTAGLCQAYAAPTANEDFVVAEAAKAYTNATLYTDNVISNLPASGLTTNDVCNIVTNTVTTAGEWRIAPSSEWETMPPNAMIAWATYDANLNPYTQETGWELPYTTGWFLIFGDSHEKIDVFMPDVGTDPDALDLGPSSADTGYSVTATRAERRNAFGFVTAADLQQNAPAPQLLLKGEDGKTYSLKIDANRALVIDEVTE